MAEQTVDPSARGFTVPEGWKKPPSLAELQRDLESARTIHSSRVTQIEAWLDALNVTGASAIKSVKGQSSIQPKLIRKQAEWRYASLSEPFLSTDSVFKVSPVTWEDKAAASQNQLLLNHQINTVIDKVKFIDEYVRTAVDEGTVHVQVGWKFQEKTEEVDVPEYQYQVDPEFLPMHQHLDQLEKESPSQYATDVPEELKQAHELYKEQGVPVKPVPTGNSRKAKKTKTIANHPTLEICDFRNLIIDPLARGDMAKAGFVIKSYKTCKAALKADGKKYQNIDKILLPSSSPLSTPDHTPKPNEANFNFEDDARKEFVAFQYWGKRDVLGTGLLTCFVAEWVGQVMIRMEDSPFPDNELPFVSEHYLPVRKDNYGEPDGALLEDNQKVVGAVTRGMIDIMGKSANGQTGIRKDMLDATNRRKFDSGRDYEYNSNVDPRQGVYMHVYPEIPASAQIMLNLQNMEAESMTGVKSWSTGVSGASLGDVAAGVRGALDAASKRELGILRRLSNGIVKCGRKMVAMNAEFLSDVEVVRVTNDEFVQIRRDDLPGNFDLKLSISTAEEDNNKAEQLAFMLQTVGPNTDPELTKIVLSDICTLRKMPDLAHKVATFEPKPDPVQQKMQELEIAKIEAEIAETRAKTQKILVDAGLHAAKTQTEQAMHDNIRSDTDNKNLDFVEQESGVHQARALEQQANAQAHERENKLIDHQFERHKINSDLLKTYIGKKSA